MPDRIERGTTASYNHNTNVSACGLNALASYVRIDRQKRSLSGFQRARLSLYSRTAAPNAP
ncbi:hypothetical protein HYPP_01978 [Hyphomicrobium sp. ghe19]|nr:hypothetical protein HYPP_01978 [Hyphomicrobium sp. ghe19]